MPLVNESRKHLTDLLKGFTKFQYDAPVNYHFATVNVKGSGDVENIGTILSWEESQDAFVVLTANVDRADSTAYVVGDVVKPLTQDGFEYVCVTAGTSGASEPTFVAIEGAITKDNTVEWMARQPYSADQTSPLPNKASICITVGAKEGVGFNKVDTTLSATAEKMTVLFRGQAGIVEQGIEFATITEAADQAEVITALEMLDIAVHDEAEVANPSYVVE